MAGNPIAYLPERAYRAPTASLFRTLAFSARRNPLLVEKVVAPCTPRSVFNMRVLRSAAAPIYWHRQEVHVRSLKSPGTLLGIIAIVLACTGSAVAGSLITGKQIAKHTITARNIKRSAITGSEIKNKSLTPIDFQGSVQGPQGAQGPPGLTSITRVNAPATPQGPFGSGTEVQASTATCPAGMFVTGGGFNAASIDDIVGFAISGPTTYTVIAVNEFSSAGSISAHAVCATGAGVSASRASLRSDAASARELVRSWQARIDGGASR